MPRKAPPRCSWNEPLGDSASDKAHEDWLLDGLEVPGSPVSRRGDSGCWDAGEIELVETVFEMTDSEVRRYIGPVLAEYYDTADIAEAVLGIDVLMTSPNFGEKLVAFVLTSAIENGTAERDLSSQLLKKLDRYLSHKDATLAFDEVLTALPELALDSPDAVPAVGKFIARSILDGLLPCSYLESGGTAAGTPGPADTLVSAALLTAAGLMSQSCDAVERVWTNVGPYSPLQDIDSKINVAVAEFRSSSDVAEVGRCLLELRVPHFHHQLVFATILTALEHGTGGEGDGGGGCAHDLLQGLGDAGGSGIVPSAQMEVGFRRVFADMDSIVLDLPWAYHLLATFVGEAISRNYLPAELAAEMPRKPPRKRAITTSN